MKPSRSKLSFFSSSLTLIFITGGYSLPALAAEAAAPVAAITTPAVTAPAFLPPGVKLVRSVEGIQEYRLYNGLQLLLVPDSSKPTTTVNITYRVGSRHENYGETGMAHLLEHLMFKGSKAHPRLWEELAQRGVSFNGSTWLDRTNYYETFAAKPETLNWAIAMEADRMVNSRISGEDLKTEFSVVRNEMEKNENSFTSALIAHVTSAAYQWHNYGKSTIGARTDVENVNIPRLKAFWRKYYQPDNATLIIAGSFDNSQALTQVSQQFGRIARPRRTIETTYTLDPVQDGERDVTVRRVGESQGIAALYHTVPAAHPDYVATEVLALILADSPGGRLYKALVEKKKATDVYPWAANMEEPGFLLLGANLRSEQNLAEAKKTMLDTIEGFAASPVTQEELDRARAKLESDLEQVYNDPEKFAVSLSDSIGNGDWRLFFMFRDRLQALKLEDVQRVAVTWLKSSNRTSGSFIPDAQPDRVPAQAKVNIAEQVKTFVPGTAMAQAENFVATPENIDRRTQTGRLNNGMKYALLPKSTRGGTVVMNFTLNLGNQDNLKGKTGAAELAAEMLGRGTQSLSHQKFTEELDKLKTKMLIDGSATSVNVSVETIRASVPRVLELMHDALRAPAFDTTEFSQVVEQDLAQLEESRKDPQAVAVDVARKQMNAWPVGDTRYYRNTEERIAELKAAQLEDARNFWAEFYGTDHAELAIVGDFDPLVVEEILQNSFGDWNAKQAYQRVPKPYRESRPQSTTRITPDKANAFFFGTMAIPVSDHHPEYAALSLGNYLLGGSTNSRILERIRQKDGISYGGGSYLNPSPVDESANFVVVAIFAPQNRAKLEMGLREEITRAVRNGFTAAEIEDAKKSLAQQFQLSRSQDNELAAEISRNLHLGRSMQFDAEYEQKLMLLTAAEVRAAMLKYLDYSKLLTVTAGDFQ
ncbi:M16 family metallopeptidase [Undibacterium sp. TJN25]|uniref:M16 family metallopeptidase n=1 Tax=Undibacterium sp. TJN25 TaxID=3413056 RepID=UPI003BF12A7C